MVSDEKWMSMFEGSGETTQGSKKPRANTSTARMTHDRAQLRTPHSTLHVHVEEIGLQTKRMLGARTSDIIGGTFPETQAKGYPLLYKPRTWRCAGLDIEMEDTHKSTPVSTSKPLSSPPTCSSMFARLYKQGLNIAILLLLSLYLLLTRFASTMSPNCRDNDLSIYTKSIFLPYMHRFVSQDVPTVNATINGIDFELPVDTGSTGLLIGAPRLPDVGPDEGTPAYEYLSSSRILYIGRLVELAITFHGAEGAFATATVPVLVVDRSVICPRYDPNVDTFHCPRIPGRPDPKLRDTSRITYMGVGFGRNIPGGGQPYGVPSRNPFLNIESINGETLQARSLRAGYTIATEGVYLGLTEKNTRDFMFTDLEPGVTHDQDPRDWAMVNMCFSLNGRGNNCGSALVDTGISQMYVRVDAGVEVPNITVRNPNKDGDAKWVQRVKPGTKIAIGFPTLGEGEVVGYSFEVGRGTQMEPSYVVPGKQGSPFVNTGRNFLFGFSVVFDAVGGRFGFRAVERSLL